MPKVDLRKSFSIGEKRRVKINDILCILYNRKSQTSHCSHKVTRHESRHYSRLDNKMRQYLNAGQK